MRTFSYIRKDVRYIRNLNFHASGYNTNINCLGLKSNFPYGRLFQTLHYRKYSLLTRIRNRLLDKWTTYLNP